MSVTLVKQYLDAGQHWFTMPTGFYADVDIYLWGAGGGKGMYGGNGGGGGYSKVTATINPGDIVEIGVGAPGANATVTDGGNGGPSYLGVGYSGGHGGYRAYYCDSAGGGPFPGGGGGGASVVFVNNNVVAVAAGGGGGSGRGHGGGYSNGLPGGSYIGLSSTTTGNRASAENAGGGGGGYKGGVAGEYISKHQYRGGSGGQNFGDVTAAGSGAFAANSGITYYPKGAVGNAGYKGAVIFVFRRRFQLWTKAAGAWKQITDAWIKAGGVWKSVIEIHNKNSSNNWVPILSNTQIPQHHKKIYEIPGSYVWVAPSDISRVKVYVYGGGGGAYGGGGGAGGRSIGFVTVTPGNAYSLSVGAGGAYTANGQASNFAGTVIANGGSTGQAAWIYSYATGGAGGTATGGSISNNTGASGQQGQAYYYWYNYGWWGWHGWNYTYYYGYNYYNNYNYHPLYYYNNWWGWPYYYHYWQNWRYGRGGQGYDGYGTGGSWGGGPQAGKGDSGAVIIIY